MSEHKIYGMNFTKIYSMYLNKVEKKGRTNEEVDEVIMWLTGHTKESLQTQLKNQVDCKTFFEKAPKLNDNRKLITGSVCGVKVQEIKEPLMREIRYLDKLIDELARGKAMKKILRVDK